MTRAEIAQLLTLAAARDRRTIGHADIAAWFEDTGDLDFDDAREALRRHFRESTDWLMPAHIRRHVKTIRAERPQHSEALALPSRFETDEERTVRVSKGVAHCRDVLAAVMEDLERRRTIPDEEETEEAIRG